MNVFFKANGSDDFSISL